MKRWKLGVFASLLLASACQTTPVETETTQFLGDPCTTPNPTFLPWDGSQPPIAGQGKVYIMYAPVNGVSLVALVDAASSTIPYARAVPSGKRATFIALTQTQLAGYIVVGGNPPPPPDVIGAILAFSAQGYLNVRPQAEGEAAQCGANGPIVGPGPIKGG